MLLARGEGVLDEKSTAALSEWLTDLQTIAEKHFEEAKTEAEKRLGGPVRLVGDTFGDLDKRPSYIFERV